MRLPNGQIGQVSGQVHYLHGLKFHRVFRSQGEFKVYYGWVSWLPPDYISGKLRAVIRAAQGCQRQANTFLQSILLGWYMSS